MRPFYQFNKSSVFALFFLLTGASLLNAQSGSNDASFNTTDVGYGAGDGFNNNVGSICLQADGKILAGGTFTSYNGVVKTRVIRLNTDFTIDGSFAATVGANSSVNAILEQPDGKIIACGQFSSYNGVSRGRINRLNADGTNDATFATGTGANNIIYTAALQADGKIIVGGTFTAYNGTALNRIARLNTDGTVDTSFHAGTGAGGTVNTIAVQADGKILVGGAFTTFNGSAINRIIRLNTDGTEDLSFTTGTGASNTISCIKVQPDGQILIGGSFTTYNGTARSRIARLNTNGTLETGFNPGTGANSTVSCIGLLPGGKIIISGNFATFNGTSRVRIARLNQAGSLDAAFNPGTGADATISVCAIQPADSMIIAGGSFLNYGGTPSFRLNRITTSGNLDITSAVTGANNIINAGALQTDGKILIGGSFIVYNGVVRNRIARVNSDGSTDTGFNPGTGANNIVYSLTLQPDGSILAGGAFTSVNGTARNRIVRLTSSGAVDPAFAPGTAANNIVYTTSLQPDGKILIGGSFTTYAGTARIRIARITSTGAVDTAFNPGSGANNIIYAIKVQPDGKILVGGSFTSFNGITKNKFVRLNTNGSIDTTFTMGTGFNGNVRDIVIQPDGKILVGGFFTTYNGATTRGIVRLNTDGTRDASFAPAANLNTGGYLTSMNLQSDGKVIIAGSFSAFGGTACNRIARLNANGTLDATVNTTVGSNNIINTSLLQPDGNVVTGGQFTAYGGTGRNRLARIIILSGINITATAATNGSITPAGTTSFVSGTSQVYNITPSPGYCVSDVMVDGSSVGPVSSYTFSNITTSHTIDVSFTAQLVPSLSISSGFINDAICAGSVVTFSVTPTNGGSAPAYQWQLNGANVATDSNYVSSSLTTGDQVTCILTANNACQTTATANSNTVTISITSVVNTSQIISICPGQSFPVGVHSYSSTGVYSDTLTSATGCDSIIETDLTVLSLNSASQNVSLCNGQSYTIGSHTYSISGAYVDTLVSSAGCDSVLTTHLIVLGAINVSTSMIAGDTLHAANSAATSWQWIDCNAGFATMPGETGQNFGVTSSGDYAVIITEGTCSDTSACVTVNLIGINNDLSANVILFRVYPNPGIGMLQVETSEGFEILVQNLTGALVHQTTVAAGINTLDLTALPDGIYTLSALDKTGGSRHYRFVIGK